MRFRSQAVALAVGASFACSTSAQAQDTLLLREGALVSVSVRDSACTRAARHCRGTMWLAGTLVRATPDSLVLQLGQSQVLPVPRLAGQQVYVSLGASRTRSALRAGLLYGAAASALLLRAEASGRRTVELTALFTGAGLFSGVLRPAQRWRRVSP